MKKFGILVAMVSMFAFEGYAEKPALSREPFIVSTGKLINYLQLSSTQVEEVAEINASSSSKTTLLRPALRSRIRRCMMLFMAT